MTELLFFIAMVLLAGLAIIGLLAVTGPGETERQRLAREQREAERQIAEIGPAGPGRHLGRGAEAGTAEAAARSRP